MIRLEHNAHHGVSRSASEQVLPTQGPLEVDQYDSRCTCCWLNVAHTWDRHDYSIVRNA